MLLHVKYTSFMSDSREGNLESEVLMWMPTLQGNYGPNMNAFWVEVTEIHTTWETLNKTLPKNPLTWRKEVWMNQQTNKKTKTMYPSA